MITYFPWKRALRKKTVWFSLLTIFTLGLVALFAPRLSPHDPYEWNVTGFSNLPPMWVQDIPTPGTEEYPLGTDRFGRDVLSRLIYGTRTAFLLALTAVPLAAIIGTTVGLVAGYSGGRLDRTMMVFADMIQSLPGIMFMVIIVLIFRGLLPPTWSSGMVTLILGFALVSWVNLARLIRINLLQIKSQLFVEAAISIGATPRRVITRHILPNLQHVILVWVINAIPAIILLEAVLGYIGVGVTGAGDGGEFTAVSWGGMFFSGRSALTRNPLMLIIPSLCILLMSMSFILLADFLNGMTRQSQE